MTTTTTPVIRTRLRVTARGRRVAAFLTAVPVAAAVAVLVLHGGAAAAGQAAGGGDFLTVTVMPGQSLWSIAEDIAPAADPRDVVSAIVRLNALGDGAVAAGQTLAVPAEYDGR
jgi:Tfp pilus assembly protein FimV